MVVTVRNPALDAENAAAQGTLREVNANQWIVGEKFTITRTAAAVPGAWRDDDGTFFHITELSGAAPDSYPLPATAPFTRVDSNGPSVPEWHIGNNAFLRVQKVKYHRGHTRVHVSMQAVRELLPTRSFTMPDVLGHAEDARHYFLVTSRARVPTLQETWAQLDAEGRAAAVQCVVRACQDLNAHPGRAIEGVDGGVLNDGWLTASERHDNCRALGMGDSPLVLHHNFISPDAVSFDSNTRTLCILDWDSVGYVPKAWVASKYRFHCDMGVEATRVDAFRVGVCQGLKAAGYVDASQSYQAFHDSMA